MNKDIEFKNILRCNFCNEKLECPIRLPCEETVCKKDLIVLLNNSQKFHCAFCGEEHCKPDKGFLSDKRIQMMLDLEINRIDLSKNHTKYVDASKKFNNNNCCFIRIKIFERGYFYKILTKLKSKPFLE